MVKLIIIVVAVIAFWFYASNIFFETFVDEPQSPSTLEDNLPVGQIGTVNCTYLVS